MSRRRETNLGGFILKLDQAGEVEWATMLYSVGSDLRVDLLSSTPTGLRVGGHANSALFERGDIQAGPVGRVVTSHFFLLEYDLGGSRTHADGWPGIGTLRNVLDVDNQRYLLGEYEGPFNFGNGVDKPSDASLRRMFVVQLNDSGQATRQRAYGFSGRTNEALRLIDAGDGLALFGYTTSTDLMTSSNFEVFPALAGSPASAKLETQRNGGIIAKLSYDLESLEWATRVQTEGAVRAHSASVHGGGFLLGYEVGTNTGAGSLPDLAIAAPAVDTAWLTVDAQGGPLGKLLFSTAGADGEPPEAIVMLERGACGDLVFGLTVGDLAVLPDFLVQPSLNTKTAFMAYRPDQVMVPSNGW